MKRGHDSKNLTDFAPAFHDLAEDDEHEQVSGGLTIWSRQLRGRR